MELGISWIDTVAIVGARRPCQADGFIGAVEFRLGAGELAEIESALVQP